ncbi:MAG TPA: cytochrome c maturation protein CcmE, partial [Usitatibacter sp.]
KGVVAQGKMGGDGAFHASEVLAKHDENYMPPEAAEALRKAGHPIDKSAFAGQKAGQ